MLALKILLVVFAIIACIALLAIALMVAVRVWLTVKLKGLTNELGDAFKDLANALPQTELKLHDAPATLLDDSPEAADMIAALKKLGFVDAGRYTIDQLPGARMAALVDIERSAAAAIVDVPGNQPFIDLGCRYTDGTWMTYSTSPSTGLERPAGMPIIRFEGATAEELAEQFFAHRPPGPFDPVSPETFKANVERYFREEMTWRMSRGFMRDQDVERIVDDNPDVAENERGEVKEFTLAIMRVKAHERVIDALRSHYAAQENLPPDSPDLDEDRTIFIYDGMPANILREILARDNETFEADQADDEDEVLLPKFDELLNQSGARTTFEFFNTRHKKIAQLEGLVPTDVYRAPNS
jgi:hypothetical protein